MLKLRSERTIRTHSRLGWLGITLAAVLFATLINGLTSEPVEAKRTDRADFEMITPVADRPISIEVQESEDLVGARGEVTPPVIEVRTEIPVDENNAGTETRPTAQPVDEKIEVIVGETPVAPADDVDIVVTEIVVSDIPQLAETATINLTKSACPDDFEGDLYQMAKYCVPMKAPFKVYSTNSNDSFDGGFTLAVLPGQTVISEEVPAGWLDPVAYCTLFHSDGSSSEYMAMLPNGGSTFTIDLKAGDYLDCQWYNIPPKGKAHLSIIKHGCPEGFLAYAKTWNELAPKCNLDMNGVNFTAKFPNGYSFNQQTGDYTDNVVYWTELPAGVYSVDESIPDGYREPIVYCIRRDVDTDDVQEVFQATVFKGNRINVELYEDSNVNCDWYNVPFTGDGVIMIDKHNCPEGAATDSEQALLEQDCTGDMNGIVFKLSGPDNVAFEQTTGDIYFSEIFADHLPGGIFTLTEKIPAGYGAPAVFCGSMEDFETEPQAVEIVADGNKITVKLPEGGIIFCDWYNIPG